MPAPGQDLMALMSGGGAPGRGPTAAPMSTPQPPAGDQQAALSQIQMAMDLLEQSLVAFGSESEQGQSLIATLNTLTKRFGATKNKAKELVPAELAMLMQAMPQAGGGSPALKAMNAPPPGGPPGGGAPPMPGPM